MSNNRLQVLIIVHPGQPQDLLGLFPHIRMSTIGNISLHSGTEMALRTTAYALSGHFLVAPAFRSELDQQGSYTQNALDYIRQYATDDTCLLVLPSLMCQYVAYEYMRSVLHAMTNVQAIHHGQAYVIDLASQSLTIIPVIP